MAKATEKKSLPSHVEEVDALKYEKLMLQAQNLEMQKTLVQAQMQALVDSWNPKYGLTKEDTIDLQTREIKRVEAEKKPE